MGQVFWEGQISKGGSKVRCVKSPSYLQELRSIWPRLRVLIQRFLQEILKVPRPKTHKRWHISPESSGLSPQDECVSVCVCVCMCLFSYLFRCVCVYVRVYMLAFVLVSWNVNICKCVCVCRWGGWGDV